MSFHPPLTPSEVVIAIREKFGCSTHIAKVLYDAFIREQTTAPERATLRDEFAKAALTGFCSNTVAALLPDEIGERQNLVHRSYDLADDMIEARKGASMNTEQAAARQAEQQNRNEALREMLARVVETVRFSGCLLSAQIVKVLREADETLGS